MEEQVGTACLGIAIKVKDLQTNSGIKDVFTQYWIDELIGKARSMQKLQPSRPPQEIQAELMVWVDANKPAIYNSFLTMPGVLSFSFSLQNMIKFFTDQFYRL